MIIRILDLKEISDMETLLELVGYFYKGTPNDTGTLKDIILEVHKHTLLVELAARLLSSGILDAVRLLEELRNTRSIITYRGQNKSCKGRYKL